MKQKVNNRKINKNKITTKVLRQVKGITLIALVVTIIVLLILAGVAISLTIGQNGIITRAQTAVVINENANVYEQLQLKVADYQMENITNNKESEILTRLKEDGYVNADNSLNVENLMGRRMQTGNGSIADGDVYVLEKRQETASSVTTDETSSLKYYLIYYGENNSASTNLGLAFEGKTEEEFYEPTDESYFEFDEYNEIIITFCATKQYVASLLLTNREYKIWRQSDYSFLYSICDEKIQEMRVGSAFGRTIILEKESSSLRRQ